jgi:hypothetical protein
MLMTRKNLMGLLLLVGWLVSPAIATAAAKVAVLDNVQATLNLKLSARQAMAGALDDLSVAMTPLEDLTPEDLACTDSNCFAEVAKRVGATHLLVLQGVANPAGYRLSLDLRDGETGRSLGTDGKDCELCAEDQFAPTVEERVKKLWTRVAKEQEAEKSKAAEAAKKKVERERSLGKASDEETPQVDLHIAKPWWKQKTPLMGLGFGTVGAIALGFGIYYIAVDGNVAEKSEIIPNRGIILRDTGKWGWTLAGLGAVSMAAGAAMMIWGQEDGSQVSVAVGPASLGLTGKF